MKKFFGILLDIFFLISMTLLGKFDLKQDSFLLSNYQIVVSIFWIIGLFKFKNRNSEVKEFLFDAFKDFIVSIAIIPLWFCISGDIQNDLYEPITIIIHLLVLGVIIYIIHKSEELSGSIVYYTHAVIPIIAVVLIRIGLPVYLSVIIAVIVPEPINYISFKKKNHL